MAKILLTGSTGGIGSAIESILAKQHLVFKANHCLVDEVPKIEGSYDWLIFAHGYIGEGHVDLTFKTNIFLPIYLIERFFPTKGVIFISSTAGITCNSKFPVYSASKAAINAYSKSMAKRHEDKTFISICPGPTNTKMWRNLGLEGEAQEPIEVAKVVERAMNGEFKSGDIITIRNGQIS